MATAMVMVYLVFLSGFYTASTSTQEVNSCHNKRRAQVNTRIKLSEEESLLDGMLPHGGKQGPGSGLLIGSR